MPPILALNVDQSDEDTNPLFVADAVGTLSVITGVVVPFATVEDKSVPLVPNVKAATDVTVPPPLGGAAHVPSALRKFVVPPPDAGASPLSVELNTSSIAVTLVPLSAIGVAADPVLLPIIEFAERFAILAKVTEPADIDAANDPVPDPVTSPVSVIVWSPVFVPDRVSPLSLISLPVGPSKNTTRLFTADEGPDTSPFPIKNPPVVVPSPP